jgi:hypothetical protein
MLVASRPVSGFTPSGRMATPTCVSRPKRVHARALRLAPSRPQAPTTRLPAPPLGRLHGERAIPMASTFQLTRSTRLPDAPEDAPGPAACDQAGPTSERDALWRYSGDLRAIAGPFRDPVADVRGRRDGGHRPGRTVVHGVFSDPEMPAAGMRQHDTHVVRGVVSRRSLGDATGAYRPAPEPDQPACDQAKDVEMEEETS